MSSKLSQIQKIVSYKSFLDFHLVYKNKSCLKFLREKLQTIKIGKNDKISSNLHLFLIFTKKKTLFGKFSINNLRPNLLIWFDWIFFRNKMKIKSQIFSVNSNVIVSQQLLNTFIFLMIFYIPDPSAQNAGACLNVATWRRERSDRAIQQIC